MLSPEDKAELTRLLELARGLHVSDWDDYAGGYHDGMTDLITERFELPATIAGAFAHSLVLEVVTGAAPPDRLLGMV